jgi:hypothetical protein
MYHTPIRVSAAINIVGADDKINVLIMTGAVVLIPVVGP